MPLRVLQILAAPFRSKKSPAATKTPSSTESENRSKRKSKSRKLRYECKYCLEHKEGKDFVKGILLPWNCQPHLTGHNRVCRSCLEASINAQMDCKTLLDIGCPQCGTAWEPDDVHMLAAAGDRKRLGEMDRQAQKRIYVPSDLNLPDQLTMDDMLARGARLCPACLYPFVKLGGCESILCGKCGKYFNIAYAPVLEDGKGHRAVDVNEESNADLL